MNKSEFIQELDTNGYVVVPQVFPKVFMQRMGDELLQAIEKENNYHGTQHHSGLGMVLMCPVYGGTFIEEFDYQAFVEPFEWVLGEECIVYTSTSSCIPPAQEIYSSRIHRDAPPRIPNYHEGIAAMIIVDDFTKENGATWFLKGSHTENEEPDETEFYQEAERCLAQSGDVVYFNPRVWHAGAPNQSSEWRRSQIVGMIRPWMKQRMDIPKMLENSDIDLSTVSEKALQKLGFFSQPPASYEEYFQPPEKRKFKQTVV